MAHECPASVPNPGAALEQHKARTMGVVIVNSQNLVLAGKRTKSPDIWSCLQVDGHGGDSNESKDLNAMACEYAHRVYGLHHGLHVTLVTSATISASDEVGNEEADDSINGQKAAAASDFTKQSQNNAGQHVHWYLFRCIDGVGDASAKSMCDLSGQRVEEPEFSDVLWRPLAQVISTVPMVERPAYLSLQHWLEPQLREHAAAVASIDLGGCWMRTALACEGVLELLVAHGFAQETAETLQFRPCVQLWEKTATPGEWQVTLFEQDGKTARRTVLYPLGEWLQPFGCGSPFGGGTEGVAKRYTAWLLDPNADVGTDELDCNDALSRQLTQCTVSFTPLGREEVRRYLRNGRLILCRKFWPSAEDAAMVTSQETFVRFKAM